MQPDDETWPAASGGRSVPARRSSRSCGSKAYEPLAAAVLDGAVSRVSDVVAGRLRAAAHRRSARRAGAAAAARARPGQLHARVRGARPRRDQGRAGRRAAARAARSRRRTRARAAVVARSARSAQIGDAARRRAARRARRANADTRSERPARSGHRARHAEGAPTGCRCVQDLLTDDWPTMRAAALRARRGDRSGELPRRARRAWSPIATGACARRSPTCSATLAAELAIDRGCARCSRTRTSASSRRCSPRWRG